MYVKQLEKFRSAIGDHDLCRRVDNHKANMSDRHAEVDDMVKSNETLEADPAAKASKRTAYAGIKLKATLGFMKATRRAVRTFVSKHVTFLLQEHREAMQYMKYWDAAREVGVLKDQPDVVAQVTTYMKELLELAQESSKTLQSDVTMRLKDVFINDPRTDLSQEQMQTLDDRYEKEVMFLSTQAGRLDAIFARGSVTVVDNLSDPRFVVVYVLKLLRLLIMWGSLRVASRVFASMYDARVYQRDSQPPSPAAFVGIFLLLDLAFNIGVVAVLLVAVSLFKSSDNDFPLDRPLLKTWALDYGCVNVLGGVLALIVGAVVARKRYFRYRYEGKRGIRAMESMLQYVFGTLILMPFFRIASG